MTKLVYGMNYGFSWDRDNIDQVKLIYKSCRRDASSLLSCQPTDDGVNPICRIYPCASYLGCR